MTQTLFCLKLKETLPALPFPPIPGEFGLKIYQNISQKAWDQWVAHQTILINEYRLNMTDPKARERLRTEMENFLFKDGSEKPEAYIKIETNEKST